MDPTNQEISPMNKHISMIDVNISTDNENITANDNDITTINKAISTVDNNINTRYCQVCSENQKKNGSTCDDKMHTSCRIYVEKENEEHFLSKFCDGIKETIVGLVSL